MKIAHKISTLALALGLATSALAAKGPESVGDVTLFGNITSYAPSWIWSVYDYPGGDSINLNPADATTADGMDNYRLDTDYHIVAEGSISALTNSEVASANFGYTDSITVSSNGADLEFDRAGHYLDETEIPVFVNTASGIVEGTMQLRAFSVRAVAEAYYNPTNTPSSQGTIYTSRAERGQLISSGDSCFTPGPLEGSVELPSVSGNPVEGTSAYPLKMPSMSPFTNQTWNRAVELLQAGVNSPQGVPAGFNVDGDWANDDEALRLCSTPTVSVARLDAMNNGATASVTAANVLGLQPRTVTVPAGTTGAWSASLTVTAAQI